MKKGLITFLMVLMFTFVNTPLIFAATNTHSINLVRTSSQYLSRTDASQTGLDISGDFTLEAWFKESSSQSGAIIAKATDTGNQIAYSFWMSGGILYLDVSDNGAVAVGNFLRFATNSAQGSTGNWKHFAVTFNIGTETAIFYVDGSSVASSLTFGTTLGATLFNSSAPFTVGQDAHAGGPLDGLVDEVRVWSVVRTSGQISSNYNTQLTCGDQTGLISYWQLNNALTDCTSNANTLTNNGSAAFSTDVPFVGGGVVAPIKIPDIIWFW